jgi:hypothetical protein
MGIIYNDLKEVDTFTEHGVIIDAVYNYNDYATLITGLINDNIKTIKIHYL